MTAWKAILAVGAAGVLSATVHATTPPMFANVSANSTDGSDTFAGIFLTPVDGGTLIGDETSQVINLASGDRITVSGYMGSDPFISYHVGFTDVGAPSVFTFTVGLPFDAPVSGPAQVRASLAGSFSMVGGNGASFTPVGGALAQVTTLSFGGGAGVNMGVDVGPAYSTVGLVGTENYLQGLPPAELGFAPPKAGPAGTWDFMTVTLTFSLSGFGDGASFSGWAEITPVPETSTGTMLALGLGVVGCVAARRRGTHPS